MDCSSFFRSQTKANAENRLILIELPFGVNFFYKICVQVLDELAFFVVFNPFKKLSSLPVSLEDKKVFKCYFFVLITFLWGEEGGGGISGMNSIQFKGD
jgi:hypothetical protein